MAAAEPKFSHITVTADDEDDVVIQAGARSTRPEAEEAPRPEAPAPRRVGASAGESAGEAAHERAEAPAPASKGKQDDYRETTLDDLKAAPMSPMQKVILALAGVGVVLIVAYCLFMR